MIIKFNWEQQVKLFGYQDEFSELALKMLLRILFNKDRLDYIMEKSDTPGYWNAYYIHNKQDFIDARKRYIEKHGAAELKQRQKEYYQKNREQIRAKTKFSRIHRKERLELDKCWE